MHKRLYFEKSKEMQYLSHRDFLRFLERLFKICNIPIVISKGFHPRPKMSFGSPISIGEEAYYEPIDIEISELLKNEYIISMINEKSPSGFHILDCIDIDGRSSIISTFNAVLYEIYFSNINEQNLFLDLLNKETILETRVKDGLKKVRDLKINVVSYEVIDNKLTLTLSNISPNAFIRIGNLDQKNIIIKRIKYLNI